MRKEKLAERYEKIPTGSNIKRDMSSSLQGSVGILYNSREWGRGRVNYRINYIINSI